MTSFRSFFEDVLGIPVVGSEAGAAAMAADKAITKTVVGAAGVRVPRTFASAPDSSDYPVIVKPAREDNSLGLTLVEHPDQLRSAILDAEQFDAGVIVEQYIPGREIRVAVIELGGELMVPAMLEYGVTHSHPMRTTDDKLELGDNGNPRAQAASLEAPMTCPAIVDSVLAASLEDEQPEHIARSDAVTIRCSTSASIQRPVSHTSRGVSVLDIWPNQHNFAHDRKWRRRPGRCGHTGLAQPDEKFHDVGKVDLMRRLQADFVPTDIDLGELRKAIKANGFTTVRRVGLTGPSELERFVAQLGPLVFTPGERPLSGTTHVFEVSNINRRAQVKSVWHTDTSYVKAPPVITVLAAVKVPRSGGDTLV